MVVLAGTTYAGRVQRDEDEAWRAIVANYGDRVEVEHESDTRAGEQPGQQPEPVAEIGPQAQGEPEPSPEPDVEPAPVGDLERADEEPFVPPAPPPLPRPPRDRLIAWAGVFGGPTLLLVFLLVGVPLPSWLAYLLVAGFVGGFVYLVIQMPRGPRDPFDDGARL